MIMMNHNLRVIVNGIDVDPSTEFFHCEGLLLLLCILENHITRPLVWNSYSGQTRRIETRYSYNRRQTFGYALGYVNEKNKSCRSHKILRYSDVNHIISCEIYDFDSDLWSTLHDAFLKGNTYWCNKNHYSIDHIIYFDFTSERFGPLLRLPLNASKYDRVNLSCVREEKLAVFHYLYYSSEIKILITTKIEASMH
ncbi:hypothetical protein EUTSA_v10000599mg, partial [Eutrema salsugineum]